MIEVRAKMTGNAREAINEYKRRFKDKMHPEMIKVAQLAAGEVNKAVSDTMSAYMPKISGSPRSGKLQRSFKPSWLIKSDTEVSAIVSSDLIYARMEDLGGTIKARNARNLAIPLTGEARLKRPKDWGKELFGFKTSMGNYVLATLGKSGRKSTRIIPQYVLKPKVKHPAKHYTKRAMLAIMPKIKDRFNAIYRARVAK